MSKNCTSRSHRVGGMAYTRTKSQIRKKVPPSRALPGRRGRVRKSSAGVFWRVHFDAPEILRTYFSHVLKMQTGKCLEVANESLDCVARFNFTTVSTTQRACLTRSGIFGSSATLLGPKDVTNLRNIYREVRSLIFS